ncbi:DNA-processing protein DprA [Salinisphaera orenii]|uniref:DNA processing protein DprA n=1 Tax=Salinisphaera orenii YIM 95161 TaxID=1051139 RepID=A0A423PQU1_9GAMM|nr:DNA-processing protein DprA [Salinisphaera halophila]ROO27947.1 DNA processing protein DprA [Salinisphaera halophila YIM 95161]
MSTRDWLRLATTPGIGATLGARLIAHYGDPAAVLAAGDAGWRQVGVPAPARRALAEPDAARIDETERWLAEEGRALITADHPHYPGPLAELTPAPPWLYAIGDTDLLRYPAVAVVGSRNPTPAGLEHAHAFGHALASAGLVVVSGLARGIDAAAHEGALAANGMTIAVCGTGLDRVYPAAHRDLAQRIADHGLLLSEFALGTQPARGNFPRRNRVIAGLCAATLVVEAARASGSLITARLASQAGRDVFALPGSIHNPLARGCHQLIRDGAKLVETTDHILEDIAGVLDGFRRPDPVPDDAADTLSNQADDAGMSDAQSALLAALGHAPARIDDLVARTGWPADAVSSTLLILELEGRVVAAPGGAYMRTG